MPLLYPDAVGVSVIHDHSCGLADLAATADLGRRVPSCPDWTLGDLVWHLAEVQDFWTHVVSTRPAGPDDYPEPARPPDDELVDRLRTATAGLIGALDGIDPAETAWSWSVEHTVGFTLRRQSHEALVHHLDAALATGTDVVIDPRLGADGIEELFDIYVTGVPDWASYTPSDAVTRLVAADTGDEWVLELGQMTGTSPTTGTSYDLPAGRRAPERDPDATISGPAGALDAWLWGRGSFAALAVDGDAMRPEAVRAMLADATV